MQAIHLQDSIFTVQAVYGMYRALMWTSCYHARDETNKTQESSSRWFYYAIYHGARSM